MQLHERLSRRARARITATLVAGLGCVALTASIAPTGGPLVAHSALANDDFGYTQAKPASEVRLETGVVGVAVTPSGNGWWDVAANGGVFTFGDAAYRGSAGAVRLNQPIVGMAATPSGGGYWLVARDGGIFSFGDAVYRGSTGGMRLNQPIVGMTTAPSGSGYWLVARDGGIFTFGSATFMGSTGAIRLNQPIVGMAATRSGHGYWLVAADGGVFNFGDAPFLGSAAGMAGQPVVGIAATRSGAGYWIAAADGEVFSFGDAPAVSPTGLGSPVVAAGTVSGSAVRLVATDGTTSVLAPGLSTAAVAASGSSSYSWMVTNDDGSPVRFNPCSPVHYVTNLSEAPAGAAQLVSAALGRVTAATGISFINDGSTTEIPNAERPAFQASYGQRWAPVAIAWARPSQTDILPGGDVIGVGGSSWVQAPGGPKIYVTGEVVINPDNTANLLASLGAGATLGELLMHELGHIVGLGHTHDTSQVMYPVLLPLPAAAYGSGDLAGLAQLGRGAGCLSTPAP